MGTRGYTVYYFNGRFYVFYNHYDSYPSALGRDLVEALPQTEDAYKIWLANLREEFRRVEHDLDSTFYSLDESRIAEIHEETRYTPERSICVLGQDKKLWLAPSPFRPDFGFDIQWHYIYDLEAEEFHVSGHSSHTFALNNVDIAFFSEDSAELDSQLILSRDPEEHALARIGLQDLSSENQCLTFVSEDPATNHGLPRGVRSAMVLARAMYSIWVNSDEVKSIAERHVIIADKAFREACYVVLGFGLGYPQSFHAMISFQRAFSGVIYQGDSPGTRGKDVTAELGSAWHVQSQSAWLCPTDMVFNIGSIHVLPCPDIHFPKVAALATAYIANFGKKQRISSFRGVVLSLKTMILVKIDGNTVRTVGPMALDTNAFFVLAAFHDASELERLGRDNRHAFHEVANSSAGKQLPAELWIRIIGMCDSVSQASCLQVSRCLRECAQEHCFLLGSRPTVAHDRDETHDNETLCVIEHLSTIRSADLPSSKSVELYALQAYYAPRSWNTWQNDGGNQPVWERWVPFVDSSLVTPDSRPKKYIALQEAAFKLVACSDSNTSDSK